MVSFSFWPKTVCALHHCGALWSIVEHCGALWGIVEHCGALWRKGPLARVVYSECSFVARWHLFAETSWDWKLGRSQSARVSFHQKQQGIRCKEPQRWKQTCMHIHHYFVSSDGWSQYGCFRLGLVSFFILNNLIRILVASLFWPLVPNILH